MNILFIHPSAPGQFEYLVPHLAQDPALHIFFLCRTVQHTLPPEVHIMRYQKNTDAKTPLDVSLREAETVYYAIRELEETHGFRPDLVVGHGGWGSMLYVRAACPGARIINYLEWYYCMRPDFEGIWFLGRTPEEIRILLTQRNAPLLSQMEASDGMFTPTHWQKSLFPAVYQPHIRVIHEGVDTDFFSPDCPVQRTITDIIPALSGEEEIVTYVSRGLEPTRHFPLFMDVVRQLLDRRPHCHVVIAGGDRTHYGSQPKDGIPWKQTGIERGGFDPARVHFTGWLSMEDLRVLFRASTVHVYLTTPFVLSWSALQAMSTGCCLIASAVEPVEEVVTDMVNGLLVENRSPERIAARIEEALTDADLRERLRTGARQTILARYRLADCLAQQTRLLLDA